MIPPSKCVFIFGSPRSGTTLLENLLNRHPQITEWYEPYYLWERFFPVDDSDIWDAGCFSEQAATKIRREFDLYGKKSGTPIVVDKTPLHAFNLEIIYRIFPEAKFIHILRDGRDATLSIENEWKKRAEIVKKKDIKGYLALTVNMLKRQPYWRYRFMAVLYELRHNFASKILSDPATYFNKSRWKGYAGWGPRFKGWQDYLMNHSTLEFNAMQWVMSVEAAIDSWAALPDQNKIEIRYEELIQSPQKTLSGVFDLLGVEVPLDFYETIPKIRKNNFNKWKTGFSRQDIQKIKPILSPLLEQLGYSKKYPW